MVLSHRPTATVSLCRLYLKLWTITQSDFSGWFLPCSNSSMLSNVFNSSHQECSNYGPRVSCDPRSSFYWPAANSGNIIEYGLHKKLKLNSVALLSFNTRWSQPWKQCFATVTATVRTASSYDNREQAMSNQECYLRK